MNHSSPLPFELGETSKGTDTDGNIITPDWVGKIFVLSDNKVNDPRKSPRRTGRQLLGVPLLNNSGITLLGKRLARLKRGGGFNDLERVDGYAASLAEKGVVLIDEYLATAGVADKYYFWGILGGPATILTPMAGADFNGDIAIAGQLVAATGTTTGATTCGRISNVTMYGDTTGVSGAFNMAANLVAVALSARTTGETNADLLANFVIKY